MSQIPLFGVPTAPEPSPEPKPKPKPKPEDLPPGERYRWHNRHAGAGQVQLPLRTCERCQGTYSAMRRGRTPRYCPKCRK